MHKKTILILVSLTLCFLVASCTFKDKESGYFTYEYDSDGTIIIIGLTSSGKEQEYLIIPEQIDGNDVTSLGETGWFVGGSFESTNLKKVYILGDTAVRQSEFFYESPNFSHLFFIKSESENIYYGIFNDIQITYLSSHAYYAYFADDNGNYQKANLSYKYNYDYSPNNDYYFIDNYSNETVKFIPPDPIREGYTFAGWFKELDCINQWDFEQDIVVVVDDYHETQLFAKWM